jgi:hypothetical protein
MKKLSAKWIWSAKSGKDNYNQAVVARREFKVGKFEHASVRITADSYYRLYVNDSWVCDGPARAWPEHYQYDEVDITSYIVKGTNKVSVVARYFGCGTFHQVPAAPGLLAQIDIKLHSGKKNSTITDKKWEVSNAAFLLSNTPKISVQMEPVECYDARLEGKLKFSPAKEICGVSKGPWQDLKPRDVAMLTREPVSFSRFLSARTILDPWDIWCVSFRRLLYPDMIEANRNVYTPVAMATIADVRKSCKLEVKVVTGTGIKKPVYVDGRNNKSGSYKLEKGRHTLVFFGGDDMSHSTELSILIRKNDDIELVNPFKEGSENPWAMAKFSEFDFIENDLNFHHLLESDPLCREKFEGFESVKKDIVKAAKKEAALCEMLQGRVKHFSGKKMFDKDGHVRFMNVEHGGEVKVKNPQALIYDNPEVTVVEPENGSVELVYDLGIQRCGYYTFELLSEAGVEVDIYGVEYITRNGTIQHSLVNRNGMTYITKDGLNNFTSFKRRSGRYIFVSLRNMKKAVKIRKFNVIESTYPVEYRGSFNCSDKSLNEIWNISATTLKLCMEDTFTDCPLYEQTLWIGDARNESLFAYQIFKAEDIARRCIEINAQSLERYPIAGAQVPSSWDCLIPAWSFLWGISVWEHYWYTGDEKWLASMWPYMLKNIDGAASMLDENDLMSCDYWNFFDWADIDSDRKVVIYNNMLLAGAVNAAIEAGGVVGDQEGVERLKKLKTRLSAAVNKLWDGKKNAYPDSIHPDGKPSDSVCQHTSFLAYLYDICGKSNVAAIKKNMTDPPENMVKVGSPFAVMYLYEAMEKAGFVNEIIDSIRGNYQPMLDDGATTVWESFPTGNLAFTDAAVGDSFPTRSHCHAWSSAPIYFFSRIILGLTQTRAGGVEYKVSPWVEGLESASGTVATHLGDIRIEWAKNGDKLSVRYRADASIKLKFARNSSMKGLKVTQKRL